MKKLSTIKGAALSLAIVSAFAALPAQAQSFTLRVPAPGMKPAPTPDAAKAAKWAAVGQTPVQFGDTAVGTIAAASLTLKNTGTAVGNIPALTPTGRHGADFAAYPSCTNVAVNATCVVNFTFTPSIVGADASAVTIDPADLQSTIGLSGNGIAAPTDQYYSSVVLQMHFDGAPGNSALAVQKGPTASGSATIAGGSYAYVGSGSMKLNSTDTVTVPGNVSTQLSGDYTIEYWFLPTAQPTGAANLVFKQPQGYPAYGASVTPSGASSLQLEVWFGNAVNGSTAGLSHPKFIVPVGTWFHLVQETIGGEKRVYLNGKTVFTSAGGQADSHSAGTIVVATGLQGYMDELRITKGVGRYNGDFTPSRAITPNQ